MEDEASQQRGREPALAATLTTSTTGAVTWAVAHYAFGGNIPPEVYGFLQLAVPSVVGWAGGCIVYRRQQRARGVPPIAPGAPVAPPDATRPPPA